MFPGLVLGGGEVFLLVIVLLLIFGASRMSTYGEKVSEMVANFRDSMRGQSIEEDTAQEDLSEDA